MDRIIEFTGNHPMLIAAFVALLAMLLKSELGARFSKWTGVGPTDATRLMNHQDGVLLDIRPVAEHNQSFIANNLHIPASELVGRLSELEKYKDKPIIAYCRSGSRSASACNVLTKNGFEQVYNLSGGIMAWQSANLPTSKN